MKKAELKLMTALVAALSNNIEQETHEVTEFREDICGIKQEIEDLQEDLTDWDKCLTDHNQILNNFITLRRGAVFLLMNSLSHRRFVKFMNQAGYN